MNSKMTRIRTVLRYLVLGPIIAVGLLSIIATGGGGGGSSAAPPTPPSGGTCVWDGSTWDNCSWGP